MKSRLSLAGLLILAAFFARETLTGERSFFLRDLHLQWYGQVESFVRAVFSGAWPLWDPYVSFGQPMLANANTQVLYPPTWLNLVMRPYTYYTLYFVFHLVLGGAGVRALARRWDASEGGAFLAGALFLVSGPFLSLGNLWNHLAGAAFMPWALLAQDHALAGSRRGLVGWAVALAMMVVAGSPDSAVLVVILSVALFIERMIVGRFDVESRRNLWIALAAFLGAGALAAAQLLPSLEMAARSVRSVMSVESRTYWSVHPGMLLQALVPVRWDSDALPLSWRAVWFGGREPYLLSLHLGLPALALAVIAAGTRGVRHRYALGAGVVFYALFALGAHTPVHSIATWMFPPLFGMRFPAKALVPAALAVALLAGLGYDAWRARRARLALGIAIVAVAAPALFNASLNPSAPIDFFRWRPDALQAVDQSDARRLFVYDYGQPGVSARLLGRASAFMSPPERTRGELWRTALGSRAYPVPPVAAAFGVYDSYGRDPLGIQPLPLARLNAALLTNEDTPALHRLLRVGAVSQVLALHDLAPDLVAGPRWPGPFFEDVRLFQVLDALPRAYLVGAAVTGEVDALLDPSFDPERAVVLSEPSPLRAASPVRGHARIVEARADRMQIETESDAEALLVLVDAYDPGWHARVDGAAAPVLRANVAFRAVPVPAGRHVVDLVYRPTSVLLGLLISTLAAVGAAVVLWR